MMKMPWWFIFHVKPLGEGLLEGLGAKKPWWFVCHVKPLGKGL
jgi:hypothetical protein